eukprot:CAMPEP_0118982202 /NCGR_PEP_ID=MMETSP1173-20130426/32257_1 /TAXON_ID=1034831 /ORGANISM="Rhizochromulina marina cf, Strain CCMP1243" /LENGTH=413 /DNA_ID=CAMNT_0006932673 /DNA_START=70 /DNA_END=1308 /DNA_ORIENTATION=-
MRAAVFLAWALVAGTSGVPSPSPTPACPSGPFTRESDVLVVVHDAGESLGLQPPVEALLAAGYVVQALVLGEPATSLYCGSGLGTRGLQVLTLPQLGVDVEVLDGNTSRHQLLAPGQVASVVAQLAPRVLVTGMVYSMQAQIARGFRSDEAVYRVGFDDGFALWSNATLTAREFVEPLTSVEEVFVTAESIAEGIQALSTGAVVTTVTGSPTLNSWRSVAANQSQLEATRSSIYSQFPSLDSSLPLLVFAGGYGGSDYTASLEVFCNATVRLLHDLAFVFAPHPGYPSDFEASLFDTWGCGTDGNLVVLDNGDGSGSACGANDAWCTTADLVCASNGSLSEASTVGGQSLSVGRPHTYVSHFSDVFTEADLILNSPSVDSLVETLNITFRSQGFYVSPTEFKSAGVPLHASAR